MLHWYGGTQSARKKTEPADLATFAERGEESDGTHLEVVTHASLHTCMENEDNCLKAESEHKHEYKNVYKHRHHKQWHKFFVGSVHICSVLQQSVLERSEARVWSLERSGNVDA